MHDVLNTKRAAEFLGLSPWTLVKWRSTGRGPKWVKFHSRVRYHRADLTAYLSLHSVTSK